jgi:L-ascorbate metabolism protein UlaG (beta-lactamase superfamily)
MIRRIALVVAVLLLLGAGWLAHGLTSRPDLSPYAALELPAAEVPPADPTRLHAVFLGVSTLLLRAGDSAILVDGFFSRPGLLSVALGRVEPDHVRIAEALARAGIERLDAVVAVHSHYDHAMDSPEVARRTGAVLVGSESTANIAHGVGFPEERLRLVRGGESFEFGALRLRVFPSRHFPHGQAMGEIREPLVPPARALDYLEGGSFSLVVEGGGATALVQGSAGHVDGALAGVRADVVFLGIGLLGTNDASYMDAYWRETVGTVRPRRVIPIHWDDFTRPLSEPLVAMPRLLDAPVASMEFVLARARADGIDVRWPPTFVDFDPLAGLGAAD